MMTPGELGKDCTGRIDTLNFNKHSIFETRFNVYLNSIVKHEKSEGYLAIGMAFILK